MADAVADIPSDVSDELDAELRKHFLEEQLIELAANAPGETFLRFSTECLMWGVAFIEEDCLSK